MNEHSIIIGQHVNGDYYASWANDNMVYYGKTPEKAFEELCKDRYPTIWHMNDKDTPLILHDTDTMPIGQTPSRFIVRETGELLK